MHRKPKSELAEIAPNVPFVVLASLFGFPGAGHIMVGRKALGLGFLSLFIAGFLGMVYGTAILVPRLLEGITSEDPLGRYLRGEMTLPPIEHPALIVASGCLAAGAWCLSAVHAGFLAYRRGKGLDAGA